MEESIIILFSLVLFFIFLYSLSVLHLLINYLRCRRREQPSLIMTAESLPFVTIQLPIFNERPVVERLLRNIAKMDYPREKLEVQVLDDSDDDSPEFTSKLIAEMCESGIRFRHIRRESRSGFKAGALKRGLETAIGDFVAIFDADFLPERDWLKKTLPAFENPQIGVVQTRWGHLNDNYSLLTRLQAFLLDYHFILEQNGRNYGNHFINFNGTAGIWRRSCILDAGDWQGDTLTEDLDLSYRAQLRGWRIKYLSNIRTMAEIPITLQAARAQQFRWNKGAAENFRKNFKKVISASGLSWTTRIHAFFHLFNSSLFVLLLLLGLLSFLVLFTGFQGAPAPLRSLLPFFSICPLIFFLSYWVAYSEANGGGWKNFLRYVPLFFGFFSIAMGLSVSNSVAVIEGHLGKKSPFIRTRKFNLGKEEKLKKQQPTKMDFRMLLETLFMLLFGAALVIGIAQQTYSLILFHLMLFLGFSYVTGLSISEGISFRRKSPR